MAKRIGTSCQAEHCGHDWDMSFMVTVSSTGSRRDRQQARSKVVRLCVNDAEALGMGMVPPALIKTIRTTVERLTQRSCDPKTRGAA